MTALLAFPGEWALIFGIALALGAFTFAVSFVVDRVASFLAA